MAPTVFRSAEELVAAMGGSLGPTGWTQVDQQRIDAFADATGDQQWIHVDPARAAAESPLGTTIAHGYLTLSMLPAFAAQLLRIDFGSSRLNYGLDRVRFPAPVPVGAELRARVTLAALEPRPQGWLLSSTYTVEVRDGDRPACIADTLALIRR